MLFTLNPRLTTYSGYIEGEECRVAHNIYPLRLQAVVLSSFEAFSTCLELKRFVAQL